jgi:vacuolar-type H+-ATPase subunit F/Vma7
MQMRLVRWALQTCQDPKRVQVIVVNDGACERLEEKVRCIQGWGDLHVVAS